LPGYELLDEIGRGGMGVVYRARDTALDRDVAVKLLSERYAADSPVGQRFLSEARITGQLQHPGIPAVHQVGRLADGRPFLAMKLIKGNTLEAILNDRPDSTAESGRLLAIFEAVCQALGYAHAHHVIHRDLKPANVMVGAFGEVQVMDWGLAKVLGQEMPAVAEALAAGQTQALTQVSPTPVSGSQTQSGSLVGTPAFIPPEQALGELEKVDERSDVFGLGALLAVILTGKPPYVGKTFEAVRVQAVRGKLEDCFSRLDASGAEPELLALCKQCLAFEPADRPADGGAVAQAVAGLRAAADERAQRAELERGQAWVREGELRKRRRVLQWAAGAVAAVLVLGIAGTTIGLIQADAARRAEKERADSEAAAKRDAETLREAADQAAAAEKAAKEQTQKRLAQIEKGVELFAGMLTGINPRAEQGSEPVYVQLRKRAEQAADALHGEAVGDALAVARLQTILGDTLRELGSYAKAVEVLGKAREIRERELGADHRDTLATLENLANAYRAAGTLPAAIALHEQVRDARVRTMGADHPDTLDTLANLANEYRLAGRLPAAIALYEQVRDARVRTMGADHPDTLTTLNSLALAYQGAGKLPEAIALQKQVRDVRVQKLGVDHLDTLTTLNNLAETYRAAGKLPEAIALFEQVRDGFVKKLGADHPSTVTTLNNLASACYTAGKLTEAVALFEQAATGVAKLRFQHEYAGWIIPNTITAYEKAGQLDKAEGWRRQWLAVIKQKAGADSSDYADHLAALELNLLKQKKWADAEPILRECLAIREKKQPDAWTTFNTQSQLGDALLVQKKYADAEPLLLKGYEGMKAREKAIPPQGKVRLTEAMERLVQLYEQTGKKDEAARWRKDLESIKAVQKREKKP
jgi:hypothetical protein